METLEYLAYAGILFVMLVSVFTIDWKDKKTYKNALMILVLIASGVGLMFLIFGT
jgi:hypothetical protein|tara:strand:- start:1598 stop:1762 length:165 start_codon:yes stop_codon:yes gene_type:complete